MWDHWAMEILYRAVGPITTLDYHQRNGREHLYIVKPGTYPEIISCLRGVFLLHSPGYFQANQGPLLAKLSAAALLL